MDSLETQLDKAFMYLQRYHPKALTTIEDKLIVAQNNIIDYIYTTTNKRKIRAFIKKELSTALELYSTYLLEDIEQISGLSWDKIGTIMSGFVSLETANQFKKWKDINDDVRNKLVNPNNLLFGHNIDDLKNNMILSANNKLRGAILNGFDSNKGISNIVRDIKEQVGILNRNQLKTVVRSSILNAINQSKNELFEDVFKDEILYYEFSAKIDTRTSGICMNNHKKKIYDIKKSNIIPPLHYNCRSTIIPITKFSKDMDSDQRVTQWNEKLVHHRDGTNSTKFTVNKSIRIPKDANGYEAFEYFDEKFKKQYLGASRYQLYKSGKATLKEMLDISHNKMIPLKELKKKLDII